jgi:hypothetical protein
MAEPSWNNDQTLEAELDTNSLLASNVKQFFPFSPACV